MVDGSESTGRSEAARTLDRPRVFGLCILSVVCRPSFSDKKSHGLETANFRKWDVKKQARLAVDPLASKYNL